jgi:hypothetical protein
MQGIVNADKAIKGALGLVVPFDAEVPSQAPVTAPKAGEAPMPH